MRFIIYSKVRNKCAYTPVEIAPLFCTGFYHYRNVRINDIDLFMNLIKYNSVVVFPNVSIKLLSTYLLKAACCATQVVKQRNSFLGGQLIQYEFKKHYI